jgi:hypothetical protein
MSKKADANRAREIIAEAEKAVSTWPEWKLRQFEALSAGEDRSDHAASSNCDQEKEIIAV